MFLPWTLVEIDAITKKLCLVPKKFDKYHAIKLSYAIICRNRFGNTLQDQVTS